MNMREWVASVIESERRQAFPLMPSVGLAVTGMNMREVIADGVTQAQCIVAQAHRFPSAACLTFMDLSVEAEAFGSELTEVGGEVPTVLGSIVTGIESAVALKVPSVGAGRSGEYLKAAGLAAREINDRPVFACHIGPFSLAGRLCGMTEALMNVHLAPKVLHTVLEKCTEFLTAYALAFREAGADGVVMAEPAAGLISPVQCDEFSSKYVKEYVAKVQTDHFMAVLHNCGSTPRHVETMVSTGAMGLHFGNAVDMAKVMARLPGDRLGLGNIDPAGVFHGGDPALVRETTLKLLEATGGFRNFIVSSGCDVPSGTPLRNMEAFFDTVNEYNTRKAGKDTKAVEVT